MKNIMLIDEAPNCAYDIFSVEDHVFNFIFPKQGQNIEFIEDVLSRCDESKLDVIFTDFNKYPQVKSKVQGINGILFYQLKKQKSKFYPNKQDSDLDGWARGWISDPTQPPVNTLEFMSKLLSDDE